MFKVNAYVTEIEADNSYEVDIDGLFVTTVTDCGDIDDSVLTFKSALTTVLEIMYGDCDFDFVCVEAIKVVSVEAIKVVSVVHMLLRLTTVNDNGE